LEKILLNLFRSLYLHKNFRWKRIYVNLKLETKYFFVSGTKLSHKALSKVF